jgi:hypothetical protein
MKTVFSKKDLTDFGNYLLSDDRLSQIKHVTHGDFQNWKDHRKAAKHGKVLKTQDNGQI